jgi:hypothetical protein
MSKRNVITLRKASGSIRNAKRAKTAPFGFAPSTTIAKNAAASASRHGVNYDLKPGILLIPNNKK